MRRGARRQALRPVLGMDSPLATAARHAHLGSHPPRDHHDLRRMPAVYGEVIERRDPLPALRGGVSATAAAAITACRRRRCPPGGVPCRRPRPGCGRADAGGAASGAEGGRRLERPASGGAANGVGTGRRGALPDHGRTAPQGCSRAGSHSIGRHAADRPCSFTEGRAAGPDQRGGSSRRYSRDHPPIRPHLGPRPRGTDPDRAVHAHPRSRCPGPGRFSQPRMVPRPDRRARYRVRPPR